MIVINQINAENEIAISHIVSFQEAIIAEFLFFFQMYVIKNEIVQEKIIAQIIIKIAVEISSKACGLSNFSNQYLEISNHVIQAIIAMKNAAIACAFQYQNWCLLSASFLEILVANQITKVVKTSTQEWIQSEITATDQEKIHAITFIVNKIKCIHVTIFIAVDSVIFSSMNCFKIYIKINVFIYNKFYNKNIKIF